MDHVDRSIGLLSPLTSEIQEPANRLMDSAADTDKSDKITKFYLLCPVICIFLPYVSIIDIYSMLYTYFKVLIHLESKNL